MYTPIGCIKLAAILPLILLIAPGGPSAAQEPVNVSGVVVDAETGEPVAGARIEIPEIGRATIADTEGGFQIARVPPGSYRARIDRLGYARLEETWAVEAGMTPRRVALAPDPVVLEGITVQASRLDQRRRAVAVSVRAFEGGSLQRSAAFDARDFLFAQGGLMRAPCPGGIGIFGDDDCIRWRGRVIRPSVYIDERPSMGGLDELAAYPLRDLYAIEVYENGRHIRAYTAWFMQHLARTNRPLAPVSLWW
jgi:hypothetical protein